MNDDFDKRKPRGKNFSGGKSSGRGPRGASRGRNAGGPSQGRSFSRRDEEGGERPPRRERPEGARSFSGKPDGRKFGGKRPDGPPGEGRGDHPQRRFDRDGEAPKRRFSRDDAPSGGRKPYERRDDRPQGERPARRPREEGERNDARRGDRPFRPREEGDAPRRNFDRTKSFDRNKTSDREKAYDRPRKFDGEKKFDRTAPRGERGERPDVRKREFGSRESGSRDTGSRKPGSWETGNRDFKPRSHAKPDDTRRGDAKPSFRKSAPERVMEQLDAAPKQTLPATDRPERIAKVLARAGVCSRREAEDLIAEGRVAVNGRVLKSAALNVGPGDKITVDGNAVAGRERTRLWLYHKPAGLVTTAHDPEGRPTVFDALPSNLPRVVSIGRLDINTEGLLLLTNDGGLARVLAHPETAWLRRYRVRVFGNPNQAELDELREGITIDGVHYGPIVARVDREQGANAWLTMDLREGKNREIKRVLEHLGFQVSRLIRISFGPFQLADLGEGAVEEVRTRVLADQLGDELAQQAGVDFEAPILHADHISEKKGRQLRAVPQSRMEEEEKGRRTEVGTTTDRRGRAVRVERIVASEKPAEELRRKTRREMAPAADDVPRRSTRKPREAEGRQDRAPRASFDRSENPRSFKSRDGEKRDFKPRGDKPFGDRAPRGDRPFRSRDEARSGDGRDGEKRDFKTRGDKAFGDRKPFAAKGNRKFGDKKFGDKPRSRDGAPRGRSDGPRSPRPPRNRDR